jgi:alpha-D-glucose phosphate-specific phosphoglucomutase
VSAITFGTDGWRGVIAADFTFDHVEKVTQSIAAYLRQQGVAGKGVVIGYDRRFMSEKFAESIASVLCGNEIPVIFSKDAVPTPVTAFTVLHHQAAGAIMVTASHNPAEYNGLKFIPEYAGPALPEVTDKIEEKLHHVLATGTVKKLTLAESEKRGLLKWVDPKEPYLEHMAAIIDFEAIRRAGLKIVVDPLYGAGIGYLEELLSRAGCEVAVIHGYRDPLFGGALPDPSARVLEGLAAKVKAERAHLGLALDGDADRFGIIDSNGTYYSPNQILYLCLFHLVQTRPWKGPVARSVATTHMLDRIAASYGLPVDETPVGFKYIGQALLKQGSILGGEESGGMSIKGHLPEKDGILANLLVTEMLALQGKSLADLMSAIETQFGLLISKRWDLTVPVERKQEVSLLLAQLNPGQVAGIPVVQRVTIDGVKLILNDGSWVLVRASGTEPLFRVYVEATNQTLLEAIPQEIRRLLTI